MGCHDCIFGAYAWLPEYRVAGEGGLPNLQKYSSDIKHQTGKPRVFDVRCLCTNLVEKW